MPVRWLSVVLVVAAGALAAPTDCIREGGQMVCTEPVVASQRINLCSETGVYTWIANLEASCGFGNVTDEADMIAKVNCFWDAAYGCPGGTATEFNGWSQPGQNYVSWNCWSLNTRSRNGYVLDQWSLMTRETTRKDTFGNCTVASGFGHAYVAWLQRTVQCSPGWNQSTLANGDLKCWRCPDNSTWTGAACACNAGYVKDPRTMLCVPVQCRVDADCADNDYCNGEERCVGGLCTRVARDCDDGRECTVDSCDATQNACMHRLDPLSCRCASVPALPDVPATLAGAPVALNAAIPCPVVDGEIGASLSYSVTGTMQVPRCDNGCIGRGSLAGDLSVTGAHCTRSATGRGSLRMSVTDTMCRDCNQNCELVCGSTLACRTKGLSGSGGLSATDFVGVTKTFGWGATPGNPGAFTVTVRCGGTLTGSLDVTYSNENDSTNSTCVACPPDCDRERATLSGAASAELGCATSIAGARKTNGSGASGCAYATIRSSGESSRTTGACGTTNCLSLRGDGEVGVRGRVQLRLGWWNVGGECSAMLQGCSEARTCGACSCPNCADGTTDWSCKVTTGAKL